MLRPPYPPNENIFGRGLGRDILWIGLLIGLVSLAVGYYYWTMNPAESPAVWQTIIFNTLTLAQLGNALSSRSNRETIFQAGLFANMTMLWALVATFLLQMAVIYLPFFNRAFSTTPLSLGDLAISLVLSTIIFLIIELVKWIRQRMGKTN